MLFGSLLINSGCGFKPRGSGLEPLPGQQLLLYSNDQYGPLVSVLREKFKALAIEVSLAKAAPGTSITEHHLIQLGNIESEQRISSVDVNGRPAEYETIMHLDVMFYLNSHEQPQVKQFTVRRDYLYDKNNTLAHDRELEILTEEMYQELGQRIVNMVYRRLQSQRL